MAGEIPTAESILKYLKTQFSKEETVVNAALGIVGQSVLKRHRWEFARREVTFNLTANVASYPLKDYIPGTFDDRYVQVKIGTKVLEYKRPRQFDKLKDQNTQVLASSTSDNISYFTFRTREEWIPVLELDVNPTSTLEIRIIYFVSDAMDYLCQKWPQVMIAGAVACLVSKKRIVAPNGAIIEVEADGQPDGDVRYEFALQKMVENSDIMPELDIMELDPYVTEAMREIEALNTPGG